MEEVRKIRDLEKLVIDDVKNINSLIIIKKCLDNKSLSDDERMAALHSLRRIFLATLEDGRLLGSSSGSNTTANKKLEDYTKWLEQQFTSYLSLLANLISTEEPKFQAPAIRTLLEVRCNVTYPINIIHNLGFLRL